MSPSARTTLTLAVTTKPGRIPSHLTQKQHTQFLASKFQHYCNLNDIVNSTPAQPLDSIPETPLPPS
jgi:hypothetical protein